jgi:ribosome recycling factor
MAAPKTILIGDSVRYESAAGIIRGEVVKIMQGWNANHDLIDWIYVQYYNEKSPSKYSITRLADTALEMMKFKVIFRDCINYDALAEQAAHERMMEM